MARAISRRAPKTPKQKITTPVGELRYVTIRGQGRENFEGDGFVYEASLFFETEDDANDFMDSVDDFYIASGGLDTETPNMIVRTNDDGESYVTFKTNTTFVTQDRDGYDVAKDVKVNVLNKFNQVRELPEGEGIGNGSIGAISGVLSYYQRKKQDGVSLNLKNIQILKYIKYVPDTGFGVVDDADFEDFEDFDDGDDEPAPRKRPARRSVEDDEDEDEPAPRKRPRIELRGYKVKDKDDEPAPRKRAARRRSVEDEDEEDDEPAQRKRAARRRSVEDEDEEDDEPAPRKRAARRR